MTVPPPFGFSTFLILMDIFFRMTLLYVLTAKPSGPPKNTYLFHGKRMDDLAAVIVNSAASAGEMIGISRAVDTFRGSAVKIPSTSFHTATRTQQVRQQGEQRGGLYSPDQSDVVMIQGRDQKTLRDWIQC